MSSTRGPAPMAHAPSSSRGQISMEYIMVTAAMLLVLILLVVIFNSLFVQNSLRAQSLQASHNVQALAAHATNVWRQGAGASEQVLLQIPASANLSASYFGSNVMVLNLLGTGDVSAATDFPISGLWPSRPGVWLAGLYNNGTHVLIRPAGRLSINISGIYSSQAFSTAQTHKLSFSNEANVSYTLDQTLVCPPTITCSYNASGTSALSPATSLVGALILTASSSTGNYSGNLTIAATPDAGAGLPSETFILPITVQVY